MTRIRFIVETVSSRRDTNGNRYHFASITSTATGRTLWIRETGGERNAASFVRSITDDWNALYCVESEIGKQQWVAARNGHPEAPWEHEVTPEMVLALEKPE